MSEVIIEKKPVGRPPEAVAPKTVDDILNEKAVAAQKMRMSAPPISVSGERTVPQKTIINRLRERDEKEGNKGKYYYGFYPEDRVSSYANDGFEITHDEHGDRYSVQTDLCLRLPMKIHQRELEAVAKRSNEKMNRRIKEDAAGVKRGGNEGVQIRAEQQTAETLGL